MEPKSKACITLPLNFELATGIEVAILKQYRFLELYSCGFWMLILQRRLATHQKKHNLTSGEVDFQVWLLEVWMLPNSLGLGPRFSCDRVQNKDQDASGGTVTIFLAPLCISGPLHLWNDLIPRQMPTNCFNHGFLGGAKWISSIHSMDAYQQPW